MESSERISPAADWPRNRDQKVNLLDFLMALPDDLTMTQEERVALTTQPFEEWSKDLQEKLRPLAAEELLSKRAV